LAILGNVANIAAVEADSRPSGKVSNPGGETGILVARGRERSARLHKFPSGGKFVDIQWKIKTL
jgi:hypothetical protein